MRHLVFWRWVRQSCPRETLHSQRSHDVQTWTLGRSGTGLQILRTGWLARDAGGNTPAVRGRDRRCLFAAQMRQPTSKWVTRKESHCWLTAPSFLNTRFHMSSQFLRTSKAVSEQCYSRLTPRISQRLWDHRVKQRQPQVRHFGLARTVSCRAFEPELSHCSCFTPMQESDAAPKVPCQLTSCLSV